MIFNNLADIGGGICCQSGTKAFLANSVLYENRARWGREIAVMGASFPSALDVRSTRVDSEENTILVESGNSLKKEPGRVSVITLPGLMQDSGAILPALWWFLF
jgi:hypothetical protein